MTKYDGYSIPLKTSNILNFKFALREDLKNNKEFLPTRAEPLATGWDVRAAFPDKDCLRFHPFMKYMIPLGFRAFCPEGWWLELKPRSSSFAKKSLHCLYGTIDESYEGQMFFSCQYIPSNSLASNPDDLLISHGEALGQLIPVRRKEMLVEEVTNEEFDALCKARNASRGSGGFGSTSK
jgi:dUTPase